MQYDPLPVAKIPYLCGQEKRNQHGTSGRTLSGYEPETHVAFAPRHDAPPRLFERVSVVLDPFARSADLEGEGTLPATKAVRCLPGGVAVLGSRPSRWLVEVRSTFDSVPSARGLEFRSVDSGEVLKSDGLPVGPPRWGQDHPRHPSIIGVLNGQVGSGQGKMNSQQQPAGSLGSGESHQHRSSRPRRGSRHGKRSTPRCSCESVAESSQRRCSTRGRSR